MKNRWRRKLFGNLDKRGRKHYARHGYGIRGRRYVYR